MSFAGGQGAGQERASEDHDEPETWATLQPVILIANNPNRGDWFNLA
jgi:hypothetical protein